MLQLTLLISYDWILPLAYLRLLGCTGINNHVHSGSICGKGSPLTSGGPAQAGVALDAEATNILTCHRWVLLSGLRHSPSR